MLNLFNEKLYIFLWFWFFILAIVTCIDFLYWLVINLWPGSRKQFLRRFLNYKGKLIDELHDYQRLEDFSSKVVRPDGVTVLRLLAANSGDLVAADVVGMLWDQAYPPPSDRKKDE